MDRPDNAATATGNGCRPLPGPGCGDSFLSRCADVGAVMVVSPGGRPRGGPVGDGFVAPCGRPVGRRSLAARDSPLIGPGISVTPQGSAVGSAGWARVERSRAMERDATECFRAVRRVAGSAGTLLPSPARESRREITMAPLTAGSQEWLTQHHQAVLITLRADGSAQSSNVLTAFDAGVFRVSVTAGRAKTRNLARDPRAIVHVL